MTIDADKKFFTDIYNRESDSLFRFCFIRVSDRERALDLTQESFARLWSAVAMGRVMEHPRAFLFTVARRLIIDWYRKTKPVSLESMAREDGENRGEEFDVPDEKITLDIEMSADAKRALEMLNNLAPQYREVIYLRYMEGFSPKDIAEILRLNVNVVSVRITRGMESLRKLMGITENNHE